MGNSIENNKQSLNEMNNFKENFKEKKGLFFGLLFGLCFWGFFIFQCLEDAFKADYIQIAGLIMGIIFGIFLLMTLLGLLSFFFKWNVEIVHQKEDKEKRIVNIRIWKFLKKYYPTIIASLWFAWAIISYHNNKQDIEYIEIALIQANESKIKSGTKGSKYIRIDTKEYPQFKFDIGGIAYQSMYTNHYVNRVKQGDTLLVMINKESYDRKIVKTQPLRLSDKIVNYHFIGIFGLKH